jgi:hypothetical protein
MFCALFCGLNAACSSIVPFKEAPKGVGRTRLQVILKDQSDILVSAYYGASCQETAKSSGIILRRVSIPFAKNTQFSNRSLGMPDPNHIGHNDFAEIYIPAQKPFAFFASKQHKPFARKPIP